MSMKFRKNIILSIIISMLSSTVFSQITSNPFCANSPLIHNVDLGFGSFRYHVPWFKFDSAGVYNFTKTDGLANLYGASGIEPVIMFKCTPRIPDSSAFADTSGWLPCEQLLWDRLHDPNAPSAETSWFPTDTTAWKNFLTAFVERYNGDGIQDYPNLVYPFRVYQLEVEMTRIWCTNNNFTYPDDYVRYINMSYRTIKQADPNAIVKMAGWGSIDLHMFYLNFIDTDSLPISQNLYVRRPQLDTSQTYQNALNNWMYIFNNAQYDVFDAHCYGLAEYFPGRADGLRTLFDPTQTKPIWALEGGGPYRNKAEVYNMANTTGYMSPQLIIENAAYVIRYYVGGMGSGFTRLAWNVLPEYDPWGQAFGDLDLLSINYEKKPSYWAYKGLASFISDYTHAEPIPNGWYWHNPDIVGYRVTTPIRNMVFIWNLNTPADIHLKGLEKQHIYPLVMGDSIWTEVTLSSDSIYTFTTQRVPLIFEGMLQSTGLQNHPIQTMQIYPNPAIHQVTVEYAGTDDLTVDIFDLRGKLTGIYYLQAGISTINISSLSAGVYILKAYSNGEIKTMKLVKTED